MSVIFSDSAADRLQQLLDQIAEISGVTLSPAAGSAPDAESVQRLADLIGAAQPAQEKSSSWDLLWQQLLKAQTAEDAARVCGQLHVDPNAKVQPLLIDFSQAISSSARSVLESMKDPYTSELVALSPYQQMLLLSAPAHASEETGRETAASLAAILEAEAMQTVDIALDGVVAISELGGYVRRLQEILAAGRMLLPSEHLYEGDALGLACLMRQVPKEAAQAFLQRYFPNYDLSAMEEEMRYALEAFFRNGLSTSDAAKEIFVHRNTLVYRLDKFQRQTGLDVRRFEDALLVRIGMLLTL